MSKFTPEDMGDRAEDNARRFELIYEPRTVAADREWDGPWRARFREPRGGKPHKAVYGKTADEAIDNLANATEKKEG